MHHGRGSHFTGEKAISYFLASFSEALVSVNVLFFLCLQASLPGIFISLLVFWRALLCISSTMPCTGLTPIRGLCWAALGLLGIGPLSTESPSSQRCDFVLPKTPAGFSRLCRCVQRHGSASAPPRSFLPDTRGFWIIDYIFSAL